MTNEILVSEYEKRKLKLIEEVFELQSKIEALNSTFILKEQEIDIKSKELEELKLQIQETILHINMNNHNYCNSQTDNLDLKNDEFKQAIEWASNFEDSEGAVIKNYNSIYTFGESEDILKFNKSDVEFKENK